MPVAEERAERAPVRPARRLEHAHACPHALVLGDDVAQPAECDLVDACGPRRGLRLLHRDLRRACPSEGRERALQLGAARRVAGMLELVADPRVEDDDGEVLGERDEPVLLGGAVEQERAAATSEQAHRRVHEADGHADRPELRFARHVGKLEPRELELRGPAEGEPDRDRQRRRGRQPGADRHRRRHALRRARPPAARARRAARRRRPRSGPSRRARAAPSRRARAPPPSPGTRPTGAGWRARPAASAPSRRDRWRPAGQARRSNPCVPR